MGNPMNRTEKKQRSFDDRKTHEKKWGRQSNFSSKLMASLSGRSFCVCPRADALFDLGFGVWILDLFFFLRFGM